VKDKVTHGVQSVYVMLLGVEHVCQAGWPRERRWNTTDWHTLVLREWHNWCLSDAGASACWCLQTVCSTHRHDTVATSLYFFSFV